MCMKVSIIIPSFQRADLLKWNLFSLARQTIPFEFETIIVNDGVVDNTEALCKQYESKLKLKYIFSGHRNLGEEIQWRVPGFALNIGAQKATGEILVLSCAEMFHINDTIRILVTPILNNLKLLGIPIGKKDIEGSFLKYLNDSELLLESQDMQSLFANIDNQFKMGALNIRLPFLMALSREQFFAIGGYDEDFTGVASEDVDFVERLLLNKCEFCSTDAKTIHLYHPRYWDVVGYGPLFQHNNYLLNSRKGQIVRNINRGWGKL
jgi:glycosyltransferase involved in cell wall biosynthesis